jgi:Glycosyl transferase family 2
MRCTISFVIAVRDEPSELLQSTIEGLLKTSEQYQREIVLVDDGSLVPPSVEYPEVVTIRNSEPIGSARSRRTGASFATGEVLVFLDPHMSFAPDWLDKMMAHVDSGALLCAAWWNWELTKPLCWGAEFVWCGKRDYHSGLSPGFSFRHLTQFPGDGAVEVPMVIGACYMMLRQSYERIGGFSPFFRTWGKLEQDLCSRAWIVGLGAKCVTGARVGHFSRQKFPYPVRWDDIEFNQLVTVRTVFQEPVARIFEQMLQPLPRQVETWLAETNFSEFRQLIESHRRMSDSEFFRRHVRDAPECLMRPSPPQLTSAESLPLPCDEAKQPAAEHGESSRFGGSR